MERIKKILKRNHLLVIGKTEIERKKFITELINISGFETFRFPSKMQTIDDYFKFMKKMHLYNAWYDAKSYNWHAMWDFHREWILRNNSLVVLEELDDMEYDDKIQSILPMYINAMEEKKKGEDCIHLIISQESENGLIEQLTNCFFIHIHREKERRTKRQIIEQNLKIIDIEGLATTYNIV